MGQAGSDLPLPEEPGLASSASSDRKSTSSGFELGHGHPGHPHSVVLEAHGPSPGKLLASNFAWEGAPAWPNHLQNSLAGEEEHP